MRNLEEEHDKRVSRLSLEEQRFYKELRSCELDNLDGDMSIADIATIVFCGMNNSTYAIDDVKKVVRKIRELRAAVNEFFAKPYLRNLEALGYEISITHDTEDEF